MDRATVEEYCNKLLESCGLPPVTNTDGYKPSLEELQTSRRVLVALGLLDECQSVTSAIVTGNQVPTHVKFFFAEMYPKMVAESGAPPRKRARLDEDGTDTTSKDKVIAEMEAKIVELERTIKSRDDELDEVRFRDAELHASTMHVAQLEKEKAELLARVQTLEKDGKEQTRRLERELEKSRRETQLKEAEFEDYKKRTGPMIGDHKKAPGAPSKASSSSSTTKVKPVSLPPTNLDLSTTSDDETTTARKTTTAPAKSAKNFVDDDD